MQIHWARPKPTASQLRLERAILSLARSEGDVPCAVIAASEPPRAVRSAWPEAADITSVVMPLLTLYRPARKYSRQRLHDALREVGHPLLGLGSSRAVFALPDGNVLKVEYDEHAWVKGSSNLREAAVWSEAYDAEHYAPVIAVARDGRWLVMARTTPLSKPELRAHRTALGDLHTSDINHAANAGWLCGRIVLHDYAI